MAILPENGCWVIGTMEKLPWFLWTNTMPWREGFSDGKYRKHRMTVISMWDLYYISGWLTIINIRSVSSSKFGRKAEPRYPFHMNRLPVERCSTTVPMASIRTMPGLTSATTQESERHGELKSMLISLVAVQYQPFDQQLFAGGTMAGPIPIPAPSVSPSNQPTLDDVGWSDGWRWCGRYYRQDRPTPTIAFASNTCVRERTCNLDCFRS